MYQHSPHLDICFVLCYFHLQNDFFKGFILIRKPCKGQFALKDNALSLLSVFSCLGGLFSLLGSSASLLGFVGLASILGSLFPLLMVL
jgi:hypothetical protein